MCQFFDCGVWVSWFSDQIVKWRWINSLLDFLDWYRWQQDILLNLPVHQLTLFNSDCDKSVLFPKKALKCNIRLISKLWFVLRRLPVDILTFLKNLLNTLWIKCLKLTLLLCKGFPSRKFKNEIPLVLYVLLIRSEALETFWKLALFKRFALFWLL